jgi:putative photosynthetic complex assembly protein
MARTAPKPDQEVIPRGVLLAIGLLLLVSLVATAAVRWSGVTIHSPDASTLASRTLRFEDGADGSVMVIDARTGRTAAQLSGEQGFLRGALRAMARERKRSGFGAEQPFELISRSDGRLTLVDPVTDQRIDLESFGPTNAGVFARLLDGPVRP